MAVVIPTKSLLEGVLRTVVSRHLLEKTIAQQLPDVHKITAALPNLLVEMPTRRTIIQIIRDSLRDRTIVYDVEGSFISPRRLRV